MSAYYNEFDPAAAAWLRELIANNLIAPGDVDERSIKDVRAEDVRGYTQCHFFAGIGLWSGALRAAGWDDDRPVWTGSCPCQPFSESGKGLGFADPRHLWPDWFRIIQECRPHQILGEQSANAGLWVDLVRADMEAIGAAFAAVDVPAAGFAQGAHRRQRLYWVADIDDAERWADVAGGHFGDWPQAGRIEGYGQSGAGCSAGGVADAQGVGCEQEHAHVGGFCSRDRPQRVPAGFDPSCADGGGMGDTDLPGLEGWELPAERGGQQPARQTGVGCDWLPCRDGRWRPVESGTFPLADADPERLGRLRGYGNGLDFETATQFVTAYMEAEVLL